jgi:molybdopterin/thiamine biosynthesis adenylyltransferase
VKLTSNQTIFSRNTGLLSEEDQKLLATTSVAIAGTGGDGGLLAERLTRFGVGKIILADPEVFEPSNTNRQFGANCKNFGRNKAEIVAEELSLINPGVQLSVYREGITKENIISIVDAADIVVDEIEYSVPSLSVLLHKECRKQDKYVFMGANIGWGGCIFCFAPDGKTFEEHFEYDEYNETINPLQYTADLPMHIEPGMLNDVCIGERPVPSLSSAVGLVAAVLAGEIILFITGKRQPVIVPAVIAVDLFSHSITTNHRS